MHSHWPKDWPESKTLICALPKKDCDELWTAYLHDHVGLPCHKNVKPGNKIATCTLRGMAKRADRADKTEREIKAFEEYQAAEAMRVAELLEEYPSAVL